MKRRSAPTLIGMVFLSAVLAATGIPVPTRAQPPTATPTAALSTPTPAPPPDVHGRWAITRTWFRRCPACAFPVTLTTPWVISQTGIDVRVDRGPRGGIVGDGAGGGYLELEGVESSGPLTLRFWYATLRVSADGNTFDGEFNGSESLINPCGSSPPQVTCFASLGYIRGQRIEPRVTPTSPPGLPTPGTSTSVPATAAVPETPIATSTPAPAAPATVPPASVTATAAPTATPAPPPLIRRYIPMVYWH